MLKLFKADPLNAAKLDTLDRAFAIVELSPKGEILRSNPRFRDLMGYSEGELLGSHHRVLVPAQMAESPDYLAFWERLRRGEYIEGEFERVRKGGDRLIVHGVYNPVRDAKGQVLRVVKVALDVTAEKRRALETQAKLEAIDNIQGAIDFSPEGVMLAVNERVLLRTGYTREEMVGQSDAFLMDPHDAASPEYKQIWVKLRAGEAVTGLFRRVGKGGRRLLLKGGYNPIRDVDGRVIRIVQYAADLSDILALGDGLEAMARGDLTHHIEASFSPEFDKLKTDFNAALTGFGGALGGVFGAINFIRDATDQLANASDLLARRTEEQAANLEEAAAALDEVSATVKFTSSNATLADQTVARARLDAEKSGEVVGRAVQAMGRIESSSKEIGNIIGVVDEIAFQTNLLALNAGVEAARAGDAGRGFAVVAAEVRALAQRSAEAAKQIKSLVSASGRDVSDGVALVRETGVALKGIVTQVAEINTLVSQITTGAAEEASIVQEVNSAVTTVDEATQQNAAMAEEATAAVVSLKEQVRELLAAVGKFKLDGHQASTATAEFDSEAA